MFGSSQCIDTLIACDGIHPGGELGFPFIIMSASYHPEKDLLEEFFRQGSISDLSVNEVEQFVSMSGKQDFESEHISILISLHERLITQ